jgi:hypothetical protein
MFENKAKAGSLEALKNRSAPRKLADQEVDDRDFPKHLGELARWLRIIRLIRGPLFWTSIVAICVSAFAVALLSWLGWVPDSLGRLVMAVWMIFFWAAMMIAFAGWILRSEKRWIRH